MLLCQTFYVSSTQKETMNKEAVVLTEGTDPSLPPRGLISGETEVSE